MTDNETSKSDEVDLQPYVSEYSDARDFVPAWRKFLGLIFASFAHLFSVGSVVLVAVVTSDDTGTIFNENGLVISTALATPLLLAFVFEFFHWRASFGYKLIRDKSFRLAGQFTALSLALVFFMAHPALIFGLLACFTISALSILLATKIETREASLYLSAHHLQWALLGRDFNAFELSKNEQTFSGLLRPLKLFSIGVGALASIAVADRLIVSEILEPAMMTAISLGSIWASFLIADGAFAFLEPENAARKSALVTPIDQGEDTPEIGFSVAGLTVETKSGQRLLSELSFSVEPGDMVSVEGGQGSGKSLLLRTLASPFDLTGMSVQGSIQVNGTDIWGNQKPKPQVDIGFLPFDALILRGSARANLSLDDSTQCFRRVSRRLEKLTSDAEFARKILCEEDASTLSFGQKKLLAIVRMLEVSPNVYLLDLPESGLSDLNITALLEVIKSERRLGKSFLVATQNRALRDACSHVLLLDQGRLIDFGSATLIRGAKSKGWSRFSGKRHLDSEENLIFWAKSMFRRPGDELNQRKIGIVISDLLTLSCQSAEDDENLVFECKNFKGRTAIKLYDSGPILTSATLEKARASQGKRAKAQSGSVLASLFAQCSKFSCDESDGQRVIQVEFSTYDPRSEPTGISAKSPSED